MPTISLTSKLRLDTALKIIKSNKLESKFTAAEKVAYNEALALAETLTPKLMTTDLDLNLHQKIQPKLLHTANVMDHLIKDHKR